MASFTRRGERASTCNHTSPSAVEMQSDCDCLRERISMELLPMLESVLASQWPGWLHATLQRAQLDRPVPSDG